MTKYDSRSLSIAANAIYQGVLGTEVQNDPAHADMSLFSQIPDDPRPGMVRLEDINDFAAEPWQTFLTKVFYINFDEIYESAKKAVTATADQAQYASTGMNRMSENRKAVEDKNLTAVFGALNTTQNRD